MCLDPFHRKVYRDGHYVHARCRAGRPVLEVLVAAEGSIISRGQLSSNRASRSCAPTPFTNAIRIAVVRALHERLGGAWVRGHRRSAAGIDHRGSEPRQPDVDAGVHRAPVFEHFILNSSSAAHQFLMLDDALLLEVRKRCRPGLCAKEHRHHSLHDTRGLDHAGRRDLFGGLRSHGRSGLELSCWCSVSSDDALSRRPHARPLAGVADATHMAGDGCAHTPIGYQARDDGFHELADAFDVTYFAASIRTPTLPNS